MAITLTARTYSASAPDINSLIHDLETRVIAALATAATQADLDDIDERVTDLEDA